MSRAALFERRADLVAVGGGDAVIWTSLDRDEAGVAQPQIAPPRRQQR